MHTLGTAIKAENAIQIKNTSRLGWYLLMAAIKNTRQNTPMMLPMESILQIKQQPIWEWLI